MSLILRITSHNNASKIEFLNGLIALTVISKCLYPRMPSIWQIFIYLWFVHES